MIKRLIVANQQQWKLEEAGYDHERVADIPRQAEKHLEFDAQWQGRAPDPRIKFDPHLHDAFGPTPLLGFKSIYLHRNLGGRFFIKQVDKLPSHQLRPKAQVSVFSQSVVLPAAA